MNLPQELWWKQAKSDFAIFVSLRRSPTSHECHLLHYLQMATEKISKAYLWRSGHAPPKSHTGFRRFLKALVSRPSPELAFIAKSFGFERADDLEKWTSRIDMLVYQLQTVAPAEAGNGPNAEYPWPYANPKQCPAEHDFELWSALMNTGHGRRLLEFVDRAMHNFEDYA